MRRCLTVLSLGSQVSQSVPAVVKACSACRAAKPPVHVGYSLSHTDDRAAGEEGHYN